MLESIFRSDFITLISSDYVPEAIADSSAQAQGPTLSWTLAEIWDAAITEASLQLPMVARSCAMYLQGTNQLQLGITTEDTKPKSNMPKGWWTEQEQNQPENWSSRPPHPIKQNKQAAKEGDVDSL